MLGLRDVDSRLKIKMAAIFKPFMQITCSPQAPSKLPMWPQPWLPEFFQFGFHMMSVRYVFLPIIKGHSPDIATSKTDVSVVYTDQMATAGIFSNTHFFYRLPDQVHFSLSLNIQSLLF